MKTYKLKDLEYYVVDCRNILHAILTFRQNKIGVTVNNIEEFDGEIPERAKVFEAV